MRRPPLKATFHEDHFSHWESAHFREMEEDEKLDELLDQLFGGPTGAGLTR